MNYAPLLYRTHNQEPIRRAHLLKASIFPQRPFTQLLVSLTALWFNMGFRDSYTKIFVGNLPDNIKRSEIDDIFYKVTRLVMASGRKKPCATGEFGLRLLAYRLAVWSDPQH